jgi:hypothetical protein
VYRGCALGIRGGGRGFISHSPRCLRTCPPLEDLFYDILVLDEGNDAHRALASFDVGPKGSALRTGSAHLRGSTSYIFWISLAQFLRYSLFEFIKHGWSKIHHLIDKRGYTPYTSAHIKRVLAITEGANLRSLIYLMPRVRRFEGIEGVSERGKNSMRERNGCFSARIT